MAYISEEGYHGEILDADESESTTKNFWLRLGKICRKPTHGAAFGTLRKPSVEFTYISVTFIHVLPPKWSGTVALRKKNVCYYIPAAT